jgi:hypothetical protein
VRSLIGLILGIVLFLLGIPTLVTLVRRFGYYDAFGYQEAVLAMLLVLACVIAAQLTGLKPPPPPKSRD